MTELCAIIAEEEQGGKTTKVINIASQVQEEENNIILCHRYKHIREELTQRAAGKLKNICDRYQINGLQDLYARGKTPKYNLIDLLNATVLKEVPKLYDSSVPINCYWDEADTLAFGENYQKSDGTLVQKDQLAFDMYKLNTFKQMWLISATWWDWIWTEYDFDRVINVPSYEGFYGAMDATYIERPESFFKAVTSALKTNSPLPADFIGLVASFPEALMDVSHRVDHHKQLTEAIENTGMMNHLSKDIDTHPRLVGGHSLSRSFPFPQNIIFYYREKNNNRHELHQHLGRVNGRRPPIIICTPEVRNLRTEDHSLKQLAIEDNVLNMPFQERREWVKDKEIRDPRNFPSPKSRGNRVVTLNPSSYEKGEESKLVEKRYEIYARGTNLETLDKGKARGALIMECFQEQYSHIYNETKNYKTMMSYDEFMKFRGTKREADYRLGIIPGTEGKRAYIHEQLYEYTEGCSIYSEEGGIVEFTKKPTKRGTIGSVETESRTAA